MLFCAEQASSLFPRTLLLDRCNTHTMVSNHGRTCRGPLPNCHSESSPGRSHEPWPVGRRIPAIRLLGKGWRSIVMLPCWSWAATPQTSGQQCQGYGRGLPGKRPTSDAPQPSTEVFASHRRRILDTQHPCPGQSCLLYYGAQGHMVATLFYRECNLEVEATMRLPRLTCTSQVIATLSLLDAVFTSTRLLKLAFGFSGFSGQPLKWRASLESCSTRTTRGSIWKSPRPCMEVPVRSSSVI